MIDRLSATLQLDRQETQRALALAALLFVLTGSYTLAKTARDVLYLAQIPASTLPQVYLGVGVITTLAAAGYGRVTRGQAAWRALEVAMWISAASLAVFAWLFRIDSAVIPVAFYLWANLYGVLLISQFWSFTNTLSNPREAKRIFGIIGVGGILGGLFGGVVAPPLTLAFGLPALLALGAVMVAAAAFATRVRVRCHEAALLRPPPEPAAEGEPLKQAYVRWLALAALCSVLVATLIDFQFKLELQRRHPSPQELASFLGLFYTATNLAALTLQIFATRWSLQTLGAGWSAAVLPAGLGVAAVATVLAPGFATVTAARLWDQVMRLSINKSAVELFFFPLEPALRRRAKALIEAGLERLGDALAGIVLMLAGATMGANTWTLAVFVLALVAVWVGAWLKVRRGYVAELGRNLRRMNLDLGKSTVSLREAGLLHEMERLLASPFERLVLHAFAMLEENAPERLRDWLPRLIDHPSSVVRALALSRVGADPDDAVRAKVAAALGDPDPEVRIAALRAYAVAGGENRLAAVSEFLDSDIPRVRLAAIESLVATAGSREEGAARALIQRLLDAPGVEERVAVVAGLGARPGPDALHEYLPRLLEDPAIEVRRAALEAAGRAKMRTLAPRLIDALERREVRSAARRGLAAFGDRVTGTLGDYLCDPSVPIAIRREVPRVLGDIGGEEAVAELARCRERDDVRLLYRVLKAANRIRSLDESVRFPRERLLEDLEFEARSHLFALVHYRSCPIGGAHTAVRLLCIALNERMDQALDRLFRRLALIYPPREIYAAYRGVLSENPRLRGNALEFLENALANEHRSLVLPLVDDSGDQGRLRFAEQRFALRPIDLEASLRDLLGGTDSWLKACALYVVGARGEAAFLPLVKDQLAAREPHVRETAAWAWLALSPA